MKYLVYKSENLTCRTINNSNTVKPCFYRNFMPNAHYYILRFFGKIYFDRIFYSIPHHVHEYYYSY